MRRELVTACELCVQGLAGYIKAFLMVRGYTLSSFLPKSRSARFGFGLKYTLRAVIMFFKEVYVVTSQSKFEGF